MDEMDVHHMPLDALANLWTGLAKITKRTKDTEFL